MKQLKGVGDKKRVGESKSRPLDACNETTMMPSDGSMAANRLSEVQKPPCGQQQCRRFGIG